MLSSFTRTPVLLTALLALAGCSGSSNLTEQFNQGRGAWNAPEYVYQPPRIKRAYADAVEAMESDDTPAAIAAFEAFNEKYPGYPGAHVNLAILHDRAGDTEKAFAELDKAEVIIPGYVYALNQRALILRRQGDFAEAEQIWIAATESDPTYRNAWYNLGVLYDLYLQDLPAALAAYQEYQSLYMASQVVESDEAVDAPEPEPDPQVAGWIVDIERRISAGQAAQASEGEEGV